MSPPLKSLGINQLLNGLFFLVLAITFGGLVTSESLSPLVIISSFGHVSRIWQVTELEQIEDCVWRKQELYSL